MRANAPLLAAALAACVRTAATPPTPRPPALAEAAAAPPPPRPPLAPVAERDLPRVFAEGRAQDVDQDGLADRVREVALLPRQSPDATLPAPALVAHALPDGRFALDDDVTRAALRSVCPDDPPLAYRPQSREEPHERAERLNALLLDAWCQQAWGRDLAGLTAGLRALQRDVGADALRGDQIDAIAQVLREFAPPITLEPVRAAALPDFPVRELPAARAVGDPTVEPACRAALADNARAVAQADALGARVAPAEGEPYSLTAQYTDDGLCAARGGEAWSIRLSQPRLRDEALTLDAALTHERGRARASMALPAFSYRQFEHRWATLGAVFDWDGDGAAEAAVFLNRWVHEDDGDRAVRVLTARGGAVAPYGPAAGFDDVAGVRDVDGDGRPDLVLRSLLHVVERCGPGDHVVEGPRRFARSLPDGSFRADDPAARAYLGRRCDEAARDGVFESDGSANELLAAACARRSGASAEAVVAALRARHRDAPRLGVGGGCVSFPDLAANALVAP